MASLLTRLVETLPLFGIYAHSSSDPVMGGRLPLISNKGRGNNHNNGACCVSLLPEVLGDKRSVLRRRCSPAPQHKLPLSYRIFILVYMKTPRPSTAPRLTVDSCSREPLSLVLMSKGPLIWLVNTSCFQPASFG